MTTANDSASPATLLVSARTAAALIDVSPATWHRLVAAGKTPKPIKLTGGTVRWRFDQLQRWVALGCPDRKTFEAFAGDES